MSPFEPPSPAPPLRIVGARQNNLRGFDLEIPHDCLVAVTGVSGSGKSSLAFDTVFAEGQWRFLESLPGYARMLMEKTARPAVDGLENVRPAVALEQRNTTRAARSTVGTVTELYDLLRILFATAGDVRCPSCGGPVRGWTADSAAEDVLGRFAGKRVDVGIPVASALEEPPSAAWASRLSARGFARVRLGAEVLGLDDPALPEAPPEGALLVLERARATSAQAARLRRALDSAFEQGQGRAVVSAEGGKTEVYGTGRRCHACDADVPEPRPVLFSFNHPLGACPTCTGFGAVLEWDEEKVVPDPSLTLAQGAIDPWQKPANRWWQEELEQAAASEGIPLDVPWADLGADVRRRVWKGEGRFEGVEDFFTYLEGKRYKMHVRVFLARYRSPRTCPSCSGARLRPEVLAVTVAGRSISEVSRLPLGDLAGWLRETGPTLGEGARDVVWRLEERLSTLLRLGLHYLTLDRATRTLSGGEAQRAALACQLSNRLAGTLYVLDEPTVGLHARDVDLLAAALEELASRGNSVLFVEHDLSLIRRASHVVELGPGGGRDGGSVLFSGPPAGLARAGTPTGRHLARGPRAAGKAAATRSPRGFLHLRGCTANNLRGVDVSFPLGVLACVTGVSGSGKSSLVEDTLVPVASSRGARGPARGFEVAGAKLSGVRLVDQDAMGRTPRSIPLTYLGAYGAVRDLFAGLPSAQRLGLSAGHFSFNVKGGRCERCQGTGFEKLEMLFFEDLYVPCDTCGGRRFRPDVLAVRFQGRSIHDVLGLTVDEGAELFRGIAKIEEPLGLLREMGLGYLVLGQPATTLSGGEAQRLKIAAELLGATPTDALYVLDEPTTGLHADDVERLLATLQRLVDAGNTVVAVEHHLAFIAAADWVIDLGPGGGEEGGRVVDTGAPRDVADRALGPTGRFLRAHLEGR